MRTLNRISCSSDYEGEARVQCEATILQICRGENEKGCGFILEVEERRKEISEKRNLLFLILIFNFNIITWGVIQ